MEMKKYVEMAKDTLANVGEKIDKSIVYAGNKTGISPMAIKGAIPTVALLAGAIIIPEVVYDKSSDLYSYTGHWVGVSDSVPSEVHAGQWLEKISEYNEPCHSESVYAIYDNVAAWIAGYGPEGIGRSRISTY